MSEVEDCKPGDWTCPNCGHESPTRTFEILEKQQKELKSLRKENTVMREALEFYADMDNWKSGFSLKQSDYKPTETEQLFRGGKRARQALREVENE